MKPAWRMLTNSYGAVFSSNLLPAYTVTYVFSHSARLIPPPPPLSLSLSLSSGSVQITLYLMARTNNIVCTIEAEERDFEVEHNEERDGCRAEAKHITVLEGKAKT